MGVHMDGGWALELSFHMRKKINLELETKMQNSERDVGNARARTRRRTDAAGNKELAPRQLMAGTGD